MAARLSPASAPRSQESDFDWVRKHVAIAFVRLDEPTFLPPSHLAVELDWETNKNHLLARVSGKKRPRDVKARLESSDFDDECCKVAKKRRILRQRGSEQFSHAEIAKCGPVPIELVHLPRWEVKGRVLTEMPTGLGMNQIAYRDHTYCRFPDPRELTCIVPQCSENSTAYDCAFTTYIYIDGGLLNLDQVPLELANTMAESERNSHIPLAQRTVNFNPDYVKRPRDEMCRKIVCQLNKDNPGKRINKKTDVDVAVIVQCMLENLPQVYLPETAVLSCSVCKMADFSCGLDQVEADLVKQWFLKLSPQHAQMALDNTESKAPGLERLLQAYFGGVVSCSASPAGSTPGRCKRKGEDNRRCPGILVPTRVNGPYPPARIFFDPYLNVYRHNLLSDANMHIQFNSLGVDGKVTTDSCEYRLRALFNSHDSQYTLMLRHAQDKWATYDSTNIGDYYMFKGPGSFSAWLQCVEDVKNKYWPGCVKDMPPESSELDRRHENKLFYTAPVILVERVDLFPVDDPRITYPPAE